MPAAIPDGLRAEVTAALSAAGASFALLHGSRVTRHHRPDSDVDVAAWWPGDAPASFDVTLPAGVVTDDLVDDDVVLARLRDPSDLAAFVAAVTAWMQSRSSTFGGP